MKRIFIACAAVCAAMAFTACGSSKESAYRKAYEKAKAQEQAQLQQAQSGAVAQVVTTPVQATPVQTAPVQSTPVVTPLEESPAQQVAAPVQTAPVQTAPAQVATTPATAPATSASNVSVRRENLDVVNGSGLKAFSVVVGAFGVRANADGVQQRLKAAGYDAQVAYNKERNLYRVIASTFDSKENAVQSRDAIISIYPGAWILGK